MSEPKTERRTFYWVWFGLFTAVSMVVNGWHGGIKAPMHFAALRDGETRILWESWKVGADQPPGWFTWGAVALGVLMPVALAFGSHALANPKPDITRTRHRANVALTGATVLGSFTLSFLAMQDMAMMLMGWSAWVAAIVPIAVDIAIVSALAGLVAHSPAMTESAVQRRVSEQVGRFQASLDSVQSSLQEQFSADLEAAQGRLQERFDADLEAVQEHLDSNLGTVQKRLQGQFEETLEAAQTRFSAEAQERSANPRPTASGQVARRSAPSVLARETLVNDPLVLTEEIVSSGGIGTQTAESIERVLRVSVENPRLSAARIAEKITAELPKKESVSKSTVHRILTRARELDAELGDGAPAERGLMAV